MNRRKALINIISLGLLAGTGGATFCFHRSKPSSDVSSLMDSKALIAELAETIIPATNTPGAKQANVQDFIINVIKSCTIEKEQKRFMKGLEDLKEYCEAHYNKSFLKCSEEEKNAILTHFERRDEYKISVLNKIDTRIFGQSFFLKLRNLTVEGYCTSRLGATEGLVYDYIPGSYQPSLKLKHNQKSWATK